MSCLQRNIEVKIAELAPEVVMCDRPEVFSVDYFFNKGLLQTQGNKTYFYSLGDKAKAEPEEAEEAMPSEEVEELRKEVQDMKKEMQLMKKEMMKELGGIRKELNGSREEVKVLSSNVADLATKCAKQSERVAEAVEISTRMLKWLHQTLPLTQSKSTPGSSGEAQKIIHSSPSIKPFQQLTTPTIPEKVPNPPRTKMLMRKPGLDQAAEGKEELEQPAKKKVKTNRPSVPPPSGSRGSQPQK